jgi:hypothetical protein
MAEKFIPPRGRQTIRKGGSLTGANGPVSRPMKLWEFEPKPNTTLAKLEAAYMAGVEAVDRVEARARANATNGKFTPEGVKDDVLRFALNDIVPELHRARTTIKKAKAEVAERRSKLTLAQPDKSDAAGAILRMQIRQKIEGMKTSEQNRYFDSYGDNLPSEVAQAILEMPAEFSGVPASLRNQVLHRALEAQHGPEFAEIAEIEQGIEAAENWVEGSRNEVRLEAGVTDERKFNEMAAPMETKHDAPWLRPGRDDSGAEIIRVVDLDRRVERPATPDEIDRGVFYTDYEHYKQGKVAP